MRVDVGKVNHNCVGFSPFNSVLILSMVMIQNIITQHHNDIPI